MTISRDNTRHIGESYGASDHDHDMIHELSKRLDALWRVDQYIANAGHDKELIEFWTDLKSREQETVTRLKGLIRHHVECNCF